MLKNLANNAVVIAVSVGLALGIQQLGQFQKAAKAREQYRKTIAKNAVKMHFDGDRFSSGSNIVTPSGKIRTLTNAHVCEAYTTLAGEIGVSTSIAQSNTFKYKKVLKVDPAVDLCLVESDATEGFTIAPTLSIGQSIYLLGHPSGQELSLLEGEFVSRKDIEILMTVQVAPGLFLSAPVMFAANAITSISYPGNSGSAVLNADGQMVGVLFAASLQVKVQNFMVPLDLVKEFLKDQ